MPLDNPEEVFYWVDENDQELGAVSRHEAHNGSFKIHRTVGILVFDENSRILLQQRSLKKDLDPGTWTVSAGGHVEYGHNYDESAHQELREELGIETALTYIGKYLVETPVQKEWVSLYKAEMNSGQEFKTDIDEVEKVEWLDIADLLTFVNEKPFSGWAKIVLKEAGYLK